MFMCWFGQEENAKDLTIYVDRLLNQQNLDSQEQMIGTCFLYEINLLYYVRGYPTLKC